MKQLVYEGISDKRSLPFNVAGTGTIQTFGVAIVGTGTLFNAELEAGSYLVDLTHNECRKVIRRDNDTKAYLETPFTTDITSSTPQIISHSKLKVKEIGLKTSGSCFLNGTAFTGEKIFSKTGNSRSSRRDFIEPVVVDATGSTMTVEILNG